MTGSIIQDQKSLQVQVVPGQVILDFRGKNLVEPVLEDFSGDPSLLVRAPEDFQLRFVCHLPTKGPWSFGFVDKQGLHLATSTCIGAEEEGETILHHFPPWDLVDLLRDIGAAGKLLPEEPGFISIKDLAEVVAFFINDGFEGLLVLFRLFIVGTGSFTMHLHILQASPLLETIQPAIAC